MTHLEARALVLPTDLQQIYDKARATYISAKYREALSINERLHEQSTLVRCLLGRIIGKRFMGLCQYRLSKLEDSRESFNEALTLAKEARQVEQVL
jgi:hypothetical protein